MAGMDMSSHATLSGPCDAYARDAYGKADGSAQRSEGRGVRPTILEWDDSTPQRRFDYGEGLVRHSGRGQDAELFNFVTDVDSGQRAEIRIMETMLGGKPSEEKR